MKRETKEKISKVKALQGKSIADVCEMPEFLDNLGKYMEAQKEDREAARQAISAGMRLQAHVIDHLIDYGIFDNPGVFAYAYIQCINGTSEFTSAEREYILQLGQQAYNLTIANFAVAEFPELKDELFPKNRAN